MSRTGIGERRASGFTLIEVMVAITIIAIVSTLIYTGFSQTAHNKQRIESDLERNHEIRMGIERMARELSMAFVSAQLNANYALQVVKTAFKGSDAARGSRIDFTSFSHARLYRDAHESDQNELSYYLADDPEDKRRKALVRREQRRIDDDPLTGGNSQVLIANVSKFELSFLDPLTGEWSNTWDTTQAAMQPNRLPTQVRIKLTVPNLRGNGPEQVFGTRASLPLQYALNHAIYYAQ
jgi:general secretion pathway protein J